MSQAAQYLIAQHVADLFRREPRNVGVFVTLNGELRAKFFGEQEPGSIDARKTKVLPFPNVYAQWIGYWRRTLAQKPPELALKEIKKTAKDNYQILDGGIVDSIGSDTIDDVTEFLFTALVSEGGIAAAIGAPDESEAAIRLAQSVEVELKKNNLLMEGQKQLTDYRHPVRRNVPVRGEYAIHNLAFFQEGDHQVVMEPLDLAVRRDKKRMEEKAGWASRVFEDVKRKESNTEAIAIVSASAEEEKSDSARYALSMLRPYASIVNWQSDSDRKSFLSARSAMAQAA